MKKKTQFLVGAFLLTAVSSTFSQGTFQNLDFEAANLPVIPAGQHGTFVPISLALPFWNAYLGTNQITQVLHNDFLTGAANVSILGPDWASTIRIDGAYTVLLQPGSTGQALVDASLGQTGLIPAGTQSIQFKSGLAQHFFAVSIGDVTLPVFLLGTNPDYSLHGADVSAFAGLTSDLRITAQFKDGDNHSVFLDSIVFSSQPIPEPSVFGLFAIGVLLLGWRLKKTRRRET